MMHRWLIIPLLLISPAWGQRTTPARIIVTVGHAFGHEPSTLKASDLTITEDEKPLSITNVVPLRGDHADLELFVVVDNCSSCEVGSKFEELSRFIISQPPTTSIGLAYIQDGQLEIVQTPTKDRSFIMSTQPS